MKDDYDEYGVYKGDVDYSAVYGVIIFLMALLIYLID